MAVLREVKYLLIRAQEDIPQSASSIYSKHETLRQYVANLDLTVAWYNKIRTTVLEVEYPLIEDQLNDIDRNLEKAEQDLNWNADGVWEYIQQIRDQVRDLEKRVQQAKDNVDAIRDIMDTWASSPLYVRKEMKEQALLGLDDRKERLNKRYAEITASGEKIHALVKVGILCCYFVSVLEFMTVIASATAVCFYIIIVHLL